MNQKAKKQDGQIDQRVSSSNGIQPGNNSRVSSSVSSSNPGPEHKQSSQTPRT